MDLENRRQLFEQLFKEYRDKVYRLCYTYTRNEAHSEDLMQECFSKIWLHLPDFENRSGIGTWIYRIAVNTCLMQLRSLQKNPVEYKDTGAMNIPEETSPDKDELSTALFRVIQELKETDRVIISMVLEDLPQKQIGEVLGITEKNVNVKVHRIKKQLKELMTKK